MGYACDRFPQSLFVCSTWICIINTRAWIIVDNLLPFSFKHGFSRINALSKGVFHFSKRNSQFFSAQFMSCSGLVIVVYVEIYSWSLHWTRKICATHFSIFTWMVNMFLSFNLSKYFSITIGIIKMNLQFSAKNFSTVYYLPQLYLKKKFWYCNLPVAFCMANLFWKLHIKYVVLFFFCRRVDPASDNQLCRERTVVAQSTRWDQDDHCCLPNSLRKQVCYLIILHYPLRWQLWSVG